MAAKIDSDCTCNVISLYIFPSLWGLQDARWTHYNFKKKQHTTIRLGWIFNKSARLKDACRPETTLKPWVVSWWTHTMHLFSNKINNFIKENDQDQICLKKSVNMWQAITALHQVLRKHWQLTLGITTSLIYVSQDENILFDFNIKSVDRPGA